MPRTRRIGGSSFDNTSSQAMYRALDTAPFLANGRLLKKTKDDTFTLILENPVPFASLKKRRVPYL